jgi:hypothetical protein
MVQGLKRQWFLRGAFKNKDKEEEKNRDNDPPQTQPRVAEPPKAGKWR